MLTNKLASSFVIKSKEALISSDLILPFVNQKILHSLCHLSVFWHHSFVFLSVSFFSIPFNEIIYISHCHLKGSVIFLSSFLHFLHWWITHRRKKRISFISLSCTQFRFCCLIQICSARGFGKRDIAAACAFKYFFTSTWRCMSSNIKVRRMHFRLKTNW